MLHRCWGKPSEIAMQFACVSKTSQIPLPGATDFQMKPSSYRGHRDWLTSLFPARISRYSTSHESLYSPRDQPM